MVFILVWFSGFFYFILFFVSILAFIVLILSSISITSLSHIPTESAKGTHLLPCGLCSLSHSTLKGVVFLPLPAGRLSLAPFCTSQGSTVVSGGVSVCDFSSNVHGKQDQRLEVAMGKGRLRHAG